MARSFWKGRHITNKFILPLYINNIAQGHFLPKSGVIDKIAPQKFLDTIHLQRRNHQFNLHQSDEIKTLMPFYIYNGYDAFVQSDFLPKTIRNVKINLAERVYTREMAVTHKIKVSKGAKRVIKRSFNKNKSTQKAQRRRQGLTKRFKKR